jgi:glucose/arabinose dehydrogenase
MKKPFFSSLLILPMLLFLYCGKINPPMPKIFSDKIEVSSIKLPDGFKIEIYADNVVNARSMALSPSGVLFVGTRDKGNVYALVDKNGDNKAEKQYLIASKLNMPNGVAFRNGDLYVAEVNRILRFKNIEEKLDNPGQPEVIYDKFPTEKHHGWKYIAFGPDGKLYVPVGAPCNICESEDKIFNSITRMNPDGTNLEIVHSGIRNTVGFNWHPTSKELWFTDNGRDILGDDVPACELNRAEKDNLHFNIEF